jgi:hypothetical protein
MPLHSNAKIGRNDPCVCGSGKKFKYCCLKGSASDNSAWRQQRDAFNWLTDAMMHHALSFAEYVPEAWLDFNQDESPLPLEEDAAERQMFMPYFLFDWDPEPRPRRRRAEPAPGLLTRSYLLARGSRLPELEGLILEEAINQPLSFYEVVRCDPGEGVVVRDVLVGGETQVIERTASQSLRPGDIAYGQLCKLPEVTTFGRLAPFAIPPGSKGSIVRLRTWLRKRIAKHNRELIPADLIRYREKVRTTYLDIRDGMRRPPLLANTDGDPLVFHTLTFRVGSAHAAFEALAPLARGISKKRLLAQAQVDDDGALREVEIPWQKKGNRTHGDWEATILGVLRISGQSLVVDVNSEKRATKIRGEIERRLGILAVHQKTVAQDPAEALKKTNRTGTDPRSSEPASEQVGPEVTEALRAEMQRWAENWIYQKVPALGGLTPLEAVDDPDGREVIESLLLQWDRQNEKLAGPEIARPDIDIIRRLLKLAPAAT